MTTIDYNNVLPKKNGHVTQLPSHNGSVQRPLSSVPEVAVLKKFDCN